MIALLLSLAALGERAFPGHPLILDAATDRYASEFVFVTTPHGIYACDRRAVTWSRITTANGLPDNQVNALGVDEGIIWAATPRGLVSADIRGKDWQGYDLPGSVEGMAFDDRYVWVAGGFGVRRFDKYAETWEEVGSIPAHDVRADKGRIWVASDSGVFRYNPDFSRLEAQPAPKYPYDRIATTPARVWFLGPERFAACSRSSETWSGYEDFGVGDWSTLGDSVFTVSAGTVRVYDPAADNWSGFREVEGLNHVNGVFASGPDILFATDSGLVVYNLAGRSTRTHNRNTGLENDSLVAVYRDDRFVYAVSRTDIAVLDTTTGTWKTEPVSPVTGRQSAAASLFALDDAGAHLRAVPGTDIRLAGRAQYSDLRSFYSESSASASYRNIAATLVGQHRTGRSLSLYYDDTDKERTLYGFGYRGTGGDVLRQSGGGFLKSEYHNFDLIPQFSTFGGNAKLKHEALGLDLQAGRLETRQRSSFFYGRSVEKGVQRTDVSYTRGTFFQIPSSVAGSGTAPDTVFVDDRVKATNTVVTRTGITFAGITGDFDPLLSGIDCFLDRSSGLVYFLTPVAHAAVIVLKAGGQEIVIQSDSLPGRQPENVYYVGPDIIPGSLEMSVTDTTGSLHPLSEFGLDQNEDGRVDPEYINHDLGFLTFPGARPFPPGVYEDTLHIFTMDVTYRSLSSSYQLDFAPVERASEEVRVDGEPALRGSDYIIDYTSGILVFLRTDLVSDFSEIEVRYSSVERNGKALFYSAQPTVGISDDVIIAPGFSSIDSEYLVHLSGRAAAGSEGGGNFRFTPQVAVNERKAVAQDYAASASYGIVGARVGYRGYSKEFEAFGAGDRRYGSLRHSGAVSLSLEPVSRLRLEARHRREYQEDSAGRQNAVQYSSGSISYSGEDFPALALLVGEDRLPGHDQRRVKLSAGREIEVSRTRLKLNGSLQNTGLEQPGTPRENATEYILDANAVLPFPLQGNLHLRRNDLQGVTAGNRRDEELRTRVGVDVIPGLYYTGTYDLRTAGFRLDRSKEVALKNQFYNDLHVAPGRWYSRLSLVNFAFGLGSSFDEYLRGLAPDYRLPGFILAPVTDGLVSSNDIRNTRYAQVQVNPVASLMLRVKRTLNASGVGRFGTPGLTESADDEVKVEYEPSGLGLFSTIWNHRNTKSYPQEMMDNVYLEWGKSWNRLLRTRLTAGFRNADSTCAGASAGRTQVNGGVETTFRFTGASFATVGLAASRNSSRSTIAERQSQLAISPAAGVTLNLLKFLYVQLNYTPAITFGKPATHTLSTRLTGQF